MAKVGLTKALALDLEDVPAGDRADAKNEVAEYLVEAILQDVARSISPVSGQRFPGLSKGYAKIKKYIAGNTKANLELSGDMLDALAAHATRKGIEIGVYGAKEAAKADGHCNLSGNSDLPLRQFIPDTNETFRRGIMDEVEAILDGYRVDAKGEIGGGVSETDLQDLFVDIEQEAD